MVKLQQRSGNGPNRDARLARLYLKYRPTYPKEVYEIIYGFLSEGCIGNTNQWRIAADIGCGTGQSTLPLCERFEHVVGVDQSEAQLDEARENLNDDVRAKVTYRTSSCCDLSFLEDSSIDLVTTAMAMHYFDLDKFYQETLRVLQPGGVLAAYGYGLPRIHKSEGHSILFELYDMKLRNYFDKGRCHIDDLYSELYKSFATSFSQAKRVDSVTLNRRFSVDEFVGYLSSWSSYQHYLQKHPDLQDPLEVAKDQFLKVFTDAAGVQQPMDVTFPVFILLGKKSHIC